MVCLCGPCTAPVPDDCRVELRREDLTDVRAAQSRRLPDQRARQDHLGDVILVVCNENKNAALSPIHTRCEHENPLLFLVYTGLKCEHSHSQQRVPFVCVCVCESVVDGALCSSAEKTMQDWKSRYIFVKEGRLQTECQVLF